MSSVIRSVLSCSRLLALLAVVATISLLPLQAPELSTFPGGFIEKTTSTVVRPTLTPSQIQALLPTRGLFTFPAPYLTQGIRLTNSSDCGGTDCVNYVGYSYWRNINNHVGSDTMLIFLGLNKAKGGGGPTLFSYNKLTDAVTNLGPLFDATSPYSWATGEGWYFSATQPTTLYLNDGPKLLRYDVVAKTFETVFDVSVQFGNDKYIWQMHSSNDDLVHSATLGVTGTWEMSGCVVYREDTRQFLYYPKIGDFDECQIDKSGQWLVIKDNVDGLNKEDNRIIDLETELEKVLLDENGAGGHSDNGYGYIVAADDWYSLPGAARLWKFGEDPLQGSLVYHTTDWAAGLGHFSHVNANPEVPPEEQYGCSSNASRLDLPRANEIVCYRLDTSLDVLVVAPVMTDLDAPGGGSDDYAKLPKGNLDVTGQYFIWTSNMASDRLDAFLVKVPAHLLTDTTLPDTTPPVIPVVDIMPGSDPNNINPNSKGVIPVAILTTGTSVENVIWADIVNVTATGNSLQKTSGCDGCADAGAISQQQITSGNGYVEFTTSETAKLRYAGLSNGNPGTRGAEIKFAIRLQSGIAEVRESGVYRAGTTFVTGDVFRVGVESGAVKYYKNGTVFYTSTVAPTYPLLVDTSLLSLNATITNAAISVGLFPGVFDATTVNPGTVCFGAGPPDPENSDCTEAHGTGHIEDADSDGDLDLVLHFNTEETGIGCGDISASLTGQTFSGQAIEGSDSINTVGCK